MKVKMFNKFGRNDVQNTLVMALQSARKPVQIEKLFISFEVDEWYTFLSLLWLAYAATSRQSDGEAMRQRYRVSYTDKKGREWHTGVWFDEEDKSIRYANFY